jgi:hypothetical protein
MARTRASARHSQPVVAKFGPFDPCSAFHSGSLMQKLRGTLGADVGPGLIAVAADLGGKHRLRVAALVIDHG